MDVISNETNEREDSSINILSIQANSLYRVNNNYKNSYLDFGNAVINNSLFAEYVRKHVVTVHSDRFSNDFITMKFDYGVNEEKEIIQASELRTYYYKQGASVTWGKNKKKPPKTINYKMLMRSPGKAKKGDCIFVREEFHKNYLNYITMGLYDKMPNDNAKIVELSAYSTLITATAIDYINLPLDNIFVVEDQTVSTQKKAYIVKTKDVEYKKIVPDFAKTEEYINNLGFTFSKNKQEDSPHLKYILKSKNALKDNGIGDYQMKELVYTKKECYVDRNQELSDISNVLWDGMGLIDESLFPQNMEGFIYCRSHFFKSCLFKGNLQEYFKNYYKEDYENAVATDMFGRQFRVKDIKIIITENSLKWMKFIDLMGGTPAAAFKYYSNFMKRNKEKFAIVKTAHKSKYGEIQRSSYQMNGSLPTVDEEILKNICEVSINYCNSLKLDDDAFLKHLAIEGGSQCNINNVLIALYHWNKDFKYTRYFKDKRKNIISRFKKERLQQGKLLQYGDNLTICGNPIALLMEVTGEGWEQEGCFEQSTNAIQCYTTRFKEGEKLAGFRSPHNSPNNIIYLENVYPKLYQMYFPELGDNVIVINGIGTDVQSRLNGQDLDTDSIYTTNQVDIVNLAQKAYNEYPTIINNIKSIGTSEYNKNMESYAKMDNKISAEQNAIGYASNIAQLALSYYFESGMKEENLEEVFVICSVLAQVAIDSAKRNFEITVMPELQRIRNFDCMKHIPKYPRFYAEVQKLKNRKSKTKRRDIDESDIGDFNCPMDIIYRIIENNVIDLRKNKKMNTKTVSFKKVFENDKNKIKGRNRKQYNNIKEIIMKCSTEIEKLDKTEEDYSENVIREYQKCVYKLSKFTIKEDTMYALISLAFQEKGKFCDILLTAFYDKSPDMFLNCFVKNN